MLFIFIGSDKIRSVHYKNLIRKRKLIMKMTIAEFYKQIEQEYGADVANAFLLQLRTSSAEITVTEAMDLLDRALLAGQPPLAPGFGRTDSVPPQLEMSKGLQKIFENLKSVLPSFGRTNSRHIEGKLRFRKK